MFGEKGEKVKSFQIQFTRGQLPTAKAYNQINNWQNLESSTEALYKTDYNTSYHEIGTLHAKAGKMDHRIVFRVMSTLCLC